MKKPTRDRITNAALLLQQRNFPDVARWMLAQDKQSAHTKRKTGARRVDVAKDGRRVRGGKAYVRMDNPDIVYEEAKDANRSD